MSDNANVIIKIINDIKIFIIILKNKNHFNAHRKITC